RARIADIATRFEAYAPGIPTPRQIDDEPTAAARRLVAAIDAGDLDGTDQAVRAVVHGASPDELGGLLAEAVLPRLAAAGPAQIFSELCELTNATAPYPERLRPLARELARNPTWRIEWIESAPPSAPVVDPTPLASLLAGVPGLGVPGSDFIYPLM